jgi:hypothetical protein
MEKLEVCEPWILAKQTRQPFPDGESETSGVLELVHMDVCGPMEKRSKGGNRFFATFTDDYSKLSVAIPIEKKRQVVAVMRNTVTRLKLQSEKKLKAVRTDRGCEYVNGEIAAYFGKKGVVHQTTARYSSEQNGVAKRLNRVLMERTRAMFSESGLPDEMWAEAVVTANYIRNRTPVSAHGKTLWKAFYGKKPDVSHMRVFGARAFMHVPGALRHKLKPVSEKGWFIGYEADAKACRILRERNNRVIVSRGVIVDKRAKENEPRSEFEISPVEAPREKPGLNGKPVRATQHPREESPNGKKDEKKRWRSRGGHRRDQGDWGNRGEWGWCGETVPHSREKAARGVVPGKHGGGRERDGAVNL